jgi:hypothetical protein
MSTFAQAGDFCPNTACADHGKPQSEHQQNIITLGKTKAGRQRFKCKTCGNTVTETLSLTFRTMVQKDYPETDETGQFWRSTMIDMDSFHRDARGIKKAPFGGKIEV